MADVAAPLAFGSREMSQALVKVFPAKRLLLDTFVKRTEVHNSDTFDIDFYTGNRAMSQFVHPRSAAPVSDKVGWTTAAYKAPYVKELVSFETANYMNRGVGEVVYSNINPNERLMADLGLQLQAMREKMRRREEWMVMKQLTSGTGIVAFSGVGIDATINNGFAASHNVTPAVAWSAAGGVPIDDLSTYRALITQDSDLSNNMKAIFSPGAWAKFYNNAQVKTFMDLRYFQMGGLSSLGGENPQGAIYHGVINGIECWEYLNYYQETTTATGALGSVTAMMPANTVILASADLRATRHYGAIQDVEASGNSITVADPYFVKSWIDPNPGVRYILMQSAPLPLIEEVNGSVLITVA